MQSIYEAGAIQTELVRLDGSAQAHRLRRSHRAPEGEP